MTKARRILRASSVDDVTRTLEYHCRTSPSNSPFTVITRGQLKRRRTDAAPAYLQARVQKDVPLPQIEVHETAKSELLVEQVLRCVVDRTLNDDMFEELMVWMG